jgi:hypothetical protein
MKTLLIYSFLITLIGCSSPHNINQNKLQAWNGTFWGMSEQDLKIQALPASWGKLYSRLQIILWWVTARSKSYQFIVKSIAAPNPPYEI